MGRISEEQVKVFYTALDEWIKARIKYAMGNESSSSLMGKVDVLNQVLMETFCEPKIEYRDVCPTCGSDKKAIRRIYNLTSKDGSDGLCQDIWHESERGATTYPDKSEGKQEDACPNNNYEKLLENDVMFWKAECERLKGKFDKLVEKIRDVPRMFDVDGYSYVEISVIVELADKIKLGYFDTATKASFAYDSKAKE